MGKPTSTFGLKVIDMRAQDWTDILQKELELRGQKEGFETKPNKETKIENALKVKPDMMWIKDGKTEIIFEIDQFPVNYQKTVYGSMLQGLVLAKQQGAKFVEIVPNDRVGKKAHIIAEILKNQFNDLPEFHVLKVRKSDKPSAMRHAQYHLKIQLDKILGAKV